MMDMANIMLEETKKVAEVNYRLCWRAANDYRPDLILASIVSISEVLVAPVFPDASWIVHLHPHNTFRVWRSPRSCEGRW
jgi:hypothetical protein